MEPARATRGTLRFVRHADICPEALAAEGTAPVLLGLGKGDSGGGERNDDKSGGRGEIHGEEGHSLLTLAKI